MGTHMGDMQQLFQLGSQMQVRWQELQSELADRTVEVTAGAGLVRVRVDGRGQLRALVIAPEAYQDRDPELLADLITGAVAEAQRRAADLMRAEVGKLPPNPLAAP